MNIQSLVIFSLEPQTSTGTDSAVVTADNDVPVILVKDLAVGQDHPGLANHATCVFDSVNVVGDVLRQRSGIRSRWGVGWGGLGVYVVDLP